MKLILAVLVPIISAICVSLTFAYYNENSHDDHYYHRWQSGENHGYKSHENHGHKVSAAPGPIAGAGLPVLAIGYGVYWLVKRRRRKTD